MAIVSIIIPFRNEFIQLERLVCGILRQETSFETEIIILDSSDMSFQAQVSNLSCNIKYVRIPPDTYNHGSTRNVGVENSSGEVLIFTVQDAVPYGVKWIDDLAIPIFNNILDAVCGIQMPNPSENTNPVEYYRPLDSPSLKIINVGSDEFRNLTSDEKLNYVGWDNVNSAYRRSALIKVPFKEIIFGEDARWAVDAIVGNLKIGYSSYAKVYHYHSFNYNYSVKRFLAEFYVAKSTINLDPVRPNFQLFVLLSWLNCILRTTKNPVKIIYWVLYNIKIFKSKQRAYGLWIDYGLLKVEEYLMKNVPMAVK